MKRDASVNATAEALLGAAETLVAAQGFARTTTRQVTELAGANVASINYHFGSQRALFQALIERMAGPLRQQREARLDALEAHADQPSVEAIVAALLDSFSSRAAEVGWLALAHILAERDEELWEQLMRFLAPTEDRYIDALHARLPELTREETAWRFHSLVASIVFQGLLENMDAMPQRLIGPDAAPEPRRRFMAFAIGALEAPSADRGAPATTLTNL